MRDKKMSGAFGLLSQELDSDTKDAGRVQNPKAAISEKESTPTEQKVSKPPAKPRAKSKPREQERRLVEIDPARVRSWRFKDREESDLQGADFERLMISIRNDGQDTPIRVRPIKHKDYDYEEIFGFRRLHACKALGKKVLAIVEDYDDRRAFVSQINENDEREAPPIWNRARNMLKGWEAELFPTMESMAVETRIARSTLTNYIRIARDMPEVIQQKVDLKKCNRDLLFFFLRLGDEPRLSEWLDTFPMCLYENPINEKAVKKSWDDFIRTNPEQEKTKEDDKTQGSKTYIGKAGKLFSINRRGDTVTINILKDGKKLMTDSELAEALQKIMDEKA